MNLCLLVFRYDMGDVPVLLNTEELCRVVADGLSAEGSWALARQTCNALNWPEPTGREAAWAIVTMRHGKPAKSVEVREISE